MENWPQLVPLVIFIPLIGFMINIFWGAGLGKRWPGWIGSGAAALSFIVAVLLWSYLANSDYQAVVVNPPFLDTWIRIPSAGLEISWQQRVDTISVTMMLIVTGVGTLIHIYAIGYMRGDERFSRFFAYLNLFLMFMLILVTGNNFLMMFVGWEGVGLCSYLLIGFWFDKPNGVGWRNSNAARKAMIVNRVGDFGLLLGIFMILTTFGTLDFYKPGEIVNPTFAQSLTEEGQREVGTAVSSGGEDERGERAEVPVYLSNDPIPTEQLGVFGQTERFLEEGKQVRFGSFSLDIQTVLVLITFFMLLGAAGKSAQIPLFVWLPDAMAGPTPVSALIHAATMVTAGIYMMVRANVLYEAAPLTSLLVTLIGASTAFVAGFIALGQWDIKRVLAYSTISQLGFMVAAVGIGAFSAAMFHLTMQAFVKALLFLGSGSIIHGVEHGVDATHDHIAPQDMRVMGGLKRRMPVTYWTYVIGALALAGIWPFAAFWSKDEILADSWLAGLFENNLGGYIALGVLLTAAGFTAFYIWRQVEMIFHGEPRSKAAEHAHESPPVMTIPLLVLAFFSLFGGVFNLPENAGIFTLFGLLERVFGVHGLTRFLEASVVNARSAEFQPAIAIGALLVGLGAIRVAHRVYGHGHAVTITQSDPLEVNPSTRIFWRFANSRLYWDEIYDRLLVRPFNKTASFLADTVDWTFWHDYFHDTVLVSGYNAIARILSQPLDLGIIDGAVNGIGRLTRQLSERLRRVQTGYVRTYAIAFLLGVVIVILIMLLPMIQR